MFAIDFQSKVLIDTMIMTPTRACSVLGICPISPTVLTFNPSAIETIVITMMATNADGTALVIRGKPYIMTSVTATITYITHAALLNCVSWEMKMSMARAFTKPMITE